MWNSGLHEAAFMGHQDVVKFLLDSGFCDVDAKNEVFNMFFKFNFFFCNIPFSLILDWKNISVFSLFKR